MAIMVSAKKTPKSTGVLLFNTTDNTLGSFSSLTKQVSNENIILYAIKNQDKILIPFVGWEVYLYKKEQIYNTSGYWESNTCTASWYH